VSNSISCRKVGCIGIAASVLLVVVVTLALGSGSIEVKGPTAAKLLEFRDAALGATSSLIPGQSPGLCGAATLSRFMQATGKDDGKPSSTKIMVVLERYTMQWGTSTRQVLEDMKWVISSRGTAGCVASLVWVSNGIRRTGSSFYINLQDGRVTPDNSEAESMVRALRSTEVYIEQ
jgi:hypothetical protein